jgi:hypothetical protein
LLNVVSLESCRRFLLPKRPIIRQENSSLAFRLLCCERMPYLQIIGGGGRRNKARRHVLWRRLCMCSVYNKLCRRFRSQKRVATRSSSLPQ